jgi:hypothetical protein
MQNRASRIPKGNTRIQNGLDDDFNRVTTHMTRERDQMEGLEREYFRTIEQSKALI